MSKRTILTWWVGGLAALVPAGVLIPSSGVVLAHGLTDQTWFHRLLWSGVAAAVAMPLLGLGGLVLSALMIAYSRSAPDGLDQSPATYRPSRARHLPSRPVEDH